VLTAEVVLAEIIAMAGVYHTTASKLHEDADEFPSDLGNAFLRFKMNESADSAAFARRFDKREALHDGEVFRRHLTTPALSGLCGLRISTYAMRMQLTRC
jgi:hypothetical protein